MISVLIWALLWWVLGFTIAATWILRTIITLQWPNDHFNLYDLLYSAQLGLLGPFAVVGPIDAWIRKHEQLEKQRQDRLTRLSR